VRARQIEAETTLRRTERAVYRDVSGETVLVDVNADIALRLNSTGAWIWEQLEQPQPVGQLARGLAERFEIDQGRALDDVVAFAREMARRELLAAS
jgi:Coenzyme PQQ synthesis protein D (PqqD)